ncbi:MULTISPECIES: putative bifunctional diguanylate cyclase/phosphodiesterase [Shewanella]|uniref:putative bifunctional diguanylate cyclase/phosphodiesterase n=1 Tax=Shewanella TaxID=22 RepID=UPI0011827C55|nr:MULTISPECIES: bifunctional diguanylate cyclase/phosphodiesterase [Shewanella]QYJ91094.1 bifunctional diguanylate cyclase/phosphodiesterase [Shewanella halotolerans]TVP11474.1 diguanylate cyclase [Shewanella sp. KCT]
MTATELIWLIVYLIAIGIAGIIYWYWHRRTELKFLKRLVTQLSQQHKVRQPLNIATIPYRFIPLYVQLQHLLKQLPPPKGRDKLTGLLNRVGLKAKLTRKMPLTHGMFVLIDIHRFRYVNDLFGFSLGDKLLQALAERLERRIGDKDMLARMNEDEFLIYFNTPMSEAELMGFQQGLAQPISIKGTVINLQLQLGYLELSLHHADVSQMLRRLDLALVRAKSASNYIAAYQEGDDRSQHRQLTIVSCFPKALEQNELYLVFQPKYNLATGDCTHAEALIRWDSSVLGPVSPGEFIPLLECAGMISLLSQWVVDQVLLQQVRWQESDIRLQLAINLAIDDLSEKQLSERIITRLKQHGLSAQVLSIEITESQLMTDMVRTVAVLNRLKRAGVKVAIDDFGTGHSSLAYLKHLPVDEVKIDRAFLTGLESDPRAQHIVRSAVDLAKGLDFSVTVEGVEQMPVFKLLQQMGVDKVQGDIYAKPMRAPELEMHWRKLNRPLC